MVNWNQVEIVETVKAYFWMLDEQLAGHPFVKSKVRLDLSPKLLDRSKGSIEYKFQNISAVLDDYDIPYVIGYLPARNVQKALRKQVAETIAARLGQQGILPRPKGNPHPQSTIRQQKVFERDPFVRLWVLQSADGKCELCSKNAPFVMEDGEPFLEVHHVILISEHGPDTPENCVALCPNCHRALHHAKNASRLRKNLYKKVARLVANPI